MSLAMSRPLLADLSPSLPDAVMELMDVSTESEQNLSVSCFKLFALGLF